MLKFEQILAIGDTHNDIENLNEKLKRINAENTLFIQVGDFGMGFETFHNHKSKLKATNKILAENNNFMFVIRGNHDNPSYWDTIGNMVNVCGEKELIYNKNKRYKSHGPCGKYLLFSNIVFVPDNTLLDITIDSEVKRCFFSGGGVSIDRTKRIENISWWKDEIVKGLSTSDTFNVDYLFTHIPPMEAVVVNNSGMLNYFIKEDSNLSDDLKINDDNVSNIIKQTNPKKIFCGHHHITQKSMISENIECTIISPLEIVSVI